MASFTQQRPATFNPYYEQIPTDAYVTVGMEKQKAYNQGVQTVQNYISSLSELPVMKEADSQYINSRVADLTTKINSVASADWGNAGLLNQAGSLASTIYKDQNVQNAVLSTQMIRQLQQSYKDLRDKHPDDYSIINEEYDMQNNVGAYLNNNNVGERYKGPTSATIGTVDKVTKKLTDMVDKVKANKVTTISPEGELMYRQDDMTYVTESQLRSAIQKNLSAEDLDLLHKQAWYNLKGYSPQRLRDTYVQDTDSEIANNTRIINNKKIANALIRDAYAKNLHMEDILSLENYNNALVNSRNSFVNKFNSGTATDQDLTFARDQMWNRNYTNSIAQLGSYDQRSTSLHVNEEAKFALTQDFQRERDNTRFKNDLVTTIAGKHPEVLKFDESTGAVSVDMSKLSSVIGTAEGGLNTVLPADIKNGDAVTQITEKSILADLTSLEAQESEATTTMQSYLKGLPEFQQFFDESGNPKTDSISQAALSDAISQIGKQIQQKGQGIPVTIPFMPKNENLQRAIMSAYNKAQESRLAIQGLHALKSRADEMINTRAGIPAGFGSVPQQITTSDGNIRNLTLNDIVRISNDREASLLPEVKQFILRHPEERENVLNQAAIDPNSEWGKLVYGPDSDKVAELLSQNSRFTTLREREKPQVYKELSEVNNPVMRTIAIPENNRDAGYLAAQNVIQTQLGNIADASTIRPMGVYQTAGGKKMMVVQYKPSDASDAKKGLVTQVVDVTTTVDSSPNSWLSNLYGYDPNPQLTSTLDKLPGNKTPLNKNNGFADALFTDNFNTMHFYQITKAGPNDTGKVPGKYYATIAVPSPNGKTYTYEELADGFNLPSTLQNYVNGLFSTQQSTDSFYKILTEKSN